MYIERTHLKTNSSRDSKLEQKKVVDDYNSRKDHSPDQILPGSLELAALTDNEPAEVQTEVL